MSEPAQAAEPEEDAAPAEDAAPTPWFAYVLWSERLRRSYVGITTDLARRFAQHQGLRAGGARATRAGRPWRMAACYGPFEDRGAASRAEYQIRRRRGRARFCIQELPGLPVPEGCLTLGTEEGLSG